MEINVGSVHRRSPIGPALLVVVAAISQEVGAAFAVGLFAALGAIGAVFVRLFVAGVILCVAVRPRLRGLSRRAWLSAVALAADGDGDERVLLQRADTHPARRCGHR